MIRVLVADDHAVVRTGLTQLVGTFEGVELVGAAANGEEAVALCAERTPDVVLMDLEMPVLDGIGATARIAAEHPDVAVVVLTSFSDRDRILRALDAGAVGYLLKDAEPEELMRAIEAAARGEAPLDPRAAGALLSARRSALPAQALLVQNGTGSVSGNVDWSMAGERTRSSTRVSSSGMLGSRQSVRSSSSRSSQ